MRRDVIGALLAGRPLPLPDSAVEADTAPRWAPAPKLITYDPGPPPADPFAAAVAANPFRPVTAAVMPASRYVRRGVRQRSSRPLPGEWAHRVLRMVREGPGFVGWATSMYGKVLTANGGGLIVQEMDGRDDTGRTVWRATSDDRLKAVLGMWAGETAGQADLAERVISLTDAVGECYQVLSKAADGRWVYSVHSPTAVELDPRAGRAVIRDVEDARPGDPHYREVDIRLVDHLYVADLEWPGQPTSQFQRAVYAIDGWTLAAMALDADLRSRLLTNGVLHFKSTPGGRDWTAEAAAWAQEVYSSVLRRDYAPLEPQSIAEFSPFLMQSEEPPSYLEVGRHASGEILSVKTDRWADVCAALDAPSQAVREGPGSASRWSGYLLQDQTMAEAVMPRGARLAGFVEHAHLRPWVRRLQGNGELLDVDMTKVRVWFQPPGFRQDNSDDVLRAAGIPGVVISREAIARAVKIDPSDLAELPDGLTEYDARLLELHGRTAEQLLNPDPDPDSDPDGGDGLPLSVVEATGPARLADGVRVPRRPALPRPGRESSADLPPVTGSLNPALGPYEAEAGSWDDLIPNGSP